MSCIWFMLLSSWPAVGVSVLDLQGWLPGLCIWFILLSWWPAVGVSVPDYKAGYMSCLWCILLNLRPAVGVSVPHLQGWLHVLYMVYTFELMTCCWVSVPYLQGWLHVMFCLWLTYCIHVINWLPAVGSVCLIYKAGFMSCIVLWSIFWADDLLLGQCAWSTRLDRCPGAPSWKPTTSPCPPEVTGHGAQCNLKRQ